LQHRCDEEDNTTLQQHLDNMKSNLISGGTVSDKERNDFLLASTSAPPRPEPVAPPAPEPVAPPAPEPVAPPAPKPVAPPRAEPLISAKAEIFELVLVDPGSETIRLLREIRYATSMGLREISDIMQRKNSVITAFKSRASAEALQQRLRKVGADVEVHGRERRKEDQKAP
jgi:ribosomal protein L7/L12